MSIVPVVKFNKFRSRISTYQKKKTIAVNDCLWYNYKTLSHDSEEKRASGSLSGRRGEAITGSGI